MALIKCPECEKEISDKVKSCPHCGFPFVEEAILKQEITPSTSNQINPKRKKRIIIGTVILGIVLILSLALFKTFTPNIVGEWVVGKYDVDGEIVSRENIDERMYGGITGCNEWILMFKVSGKAVIQTSNITSKSQVAIFDYTMDGNVVEIYNDEMTILLTFENGNLTMPLDINIFPFPISAIFIRK